ncbi:hypothetical protein, partial [Shigella sonnei]|uniref:hypothetical protein n=1 Tax=Shigella sonnei TaxID=624 RepID=UPI0020956C2C
ISVIREYIEIFYNRQRRHSRLGLLAPSDAILFQEGVSVKLRLPKSKVERMVKYLKENFFVRYRRFDSFTHVNQQLE